MDMGAPHCHGERQKTVQARRTLPEGEGPTLANGPEFLAQFCLRKPIVQEVRIPVGYPINACRIPWTGPYTSEDFHSSSMCTCTEQEHNQCLFADEDLASVFCPGNPFFMDSMRQAMALAVVSVVQHGG
ncbi:hypothetical protein H8959_004846 [Pygathrix nigripes]